MIPHSISTFATKPQPGFNRSDSFLSIGGSTSMSNFTTTSASSDALAPDPTPVCPKAFVIRNGRQLHSDTTLAYALPVDLAELHRQSLRTLVSLELFGSPTCSPTLLSKPPTRVLEVACGSAVWSMMCHRYFARRGHPNIEFVGLDIAPLAPGPADMPDKDMNWTFVQHDIRKLPLPFESESFGLIILKDATTVASLAESLGVIEEYLRILVPGGTMEVWESDSIFSCLAKSNALATENGDEADDNDEGGGGGANGVPDSENSGGGDDSSHGDNTINDQDENSPDDADGLAAADDLCDDHCDDDDQDDDECVAVKLGAYLITAPTPLAKSTNPYLMEYNEWVAKALDLRGSSAAPCTIMESFFKMMEDYMGDIGFRRMAIPLSETAWEREYGTVGGIVARDGTGLIKSKKKKQKRVATKMKRQPGTLPSSTPPSVIDSAGLPQPGSSLKPAQAAIRRTLLLSVVQMIQGLEFLLRDVNGKNPEDWEAWVTKMTENLLNENGTSAGECLEVGVWWARKRPLD